MNPLYCLFLLFLCFSPCKSQLTIPAKIDGFAYKKPIVWGESVVVEAFLDPVCPDSRDSWLPLKQALDYYSGRLSLVVHLFPLPYHSNAYIACRAIHIANHVNSSSVYPLLELFFKTQEKYYNAPTYTMSREFIIADMAKLALTAVGDSFSAAFQLGFNDSRTDQAAKISFKYGCTRGVASTPTFFVNGMPLSNSGSPLVYNKWRSIVDPLLLKKRS